MEVSICIPKEREKSKLEIPLTMVVTIRNPEIYQKNVEYSILKYKDEIELITLYHNYSATVSLNTGLELASNDIVMCCHQDIEFKEGWYKILKRRIEELNKLDENWVICGFAGATFEGKSVGTHSGLGMNNETIIPVQTLDGSVLIINKKRYNENKLKLDEKLKYFHMYDIDICLQVHELFGEKGVYCIDVPIVHNCTWSAGEGLLESVKYIKDKWQDKVGLIHTTLGCINYMV